ncbi:MAG: hypothetical protein JSU72_13425 [Deltaproteobacteria bacterium]|nr:MAG: hypothetical protein JSU72_13425 [Deltaproteobacteria bacterium]
MTIGSPDDAPEINEAQRSLFKVRPDHTGDFIWMMVERSATTRGRIEDLIRTQTIRSLIYSPLPYIKELIETLGPPEHVTPPSESKKDACAA